VETGFSYYFGTDTEKNKAILAKAADAGMRYVFTSMHIPEEKVENYREKVLEFIRACRSRNFKCMVDVSPHTLEKLRCADYGELAALGVEHLRLDFGFSNKEIVELSRSFNIVFNASTQSQSDLDDWRNLGADFSRFFACHNFYPKPLTGLSMESVAKTNARLTSQGFTTMAFVAGDKPGEAGRRGPLFAGLPTVEEHRAADPFLSMLALRFDAGCDIVLLGDIDASDETWRRIKEYNEGYVSLRSILDSDFENLKNIVHHDRPDSSEHVLRSVESRLAGRKVAPKGRADPRKAGDVFISNSNFLRYEGELEIARKELDPDERVNVVGHVHQEDLPYVRYIKDGLGFMLQ